MWMPTKRGYVTKRGRQRRYRAARGPGRRSIPDAEAGAIRDRLAGFIRDRYGSVYEFTATFGHADSTVQGWLSKTKPRVPDSATLLALARDTRLSLDWLILGEGAAELRDTSASMGVFADELRRTLVAELVAHGGVHVREAEMTLPEPRALFRSVLAQWRERVGDFRRAVGRALHRQPVEPHRARGTR